MSILLGSQILICDDSNIERLYAVNSLRNEGFSRIYQAKTWDEARDICSSYSIDCCILDLMMPEGEGTRLIEDLRQFPGYDRVPMIIVTASNSEEKSWSCMENGADDFITKPYPEKALAIRVKLHLERFIAESRYRNLIKNMSSGVFVYRPVENGNDFEFTGFNVACENIVNIKRENILGKKYTEIFNSEKDLELLEVLQRVSLTGKPENFLFSKYEQDRLVSWCEYYLYRLPNEEIVAVCDDLTEKMLTVEKLKCINQRLRLAADGARFGVWELDLRSYLFDWDDWVYKIYGLVPGEFDLKFSTWEELVHPDDLKNIHKRLLELRSGDKIFDFEFRIFKPSKEMRYVKCHEIVSFTEDGQPRQLTGIIYDITEQKLAEIKLAESAVRDALTGIHNRRYLYERLQELLARHIRDDSNFSLAVFDLDHFKVVNDKFGHLNGDRVLQNFAELLLASVRLNDIVARFGGEEFVVVFVDVDKNQAHGFCKHILDMVKANPLKTGDLTVEYSFTCGVVDITDWDHLPSGIDHLIARADKLLYKGKNSGRCQVVCE